MKGFDMSNGFTQMRNHQGPKQDNHNGRGNSNQHCGPASMLWPKIVQSSDDHDGCTGKPFGMRHPQVEESRECAHRRSDDIVGNQEEGADNREDLGAVTDTRIDSTTIRIEAADGHVVESDERREDAHGPDEPG